MILKSIELQNFRNYAKKEFKFGENTTLIVGPNTSGKSNLIEAIFFLTSGRSFRIDRDEQLVKFGEEVARIKGKVARLQLPSQSDGGQEDKELEAVIAQGGVGGRRVPFKKYLVNGVSKRKVDFVGNFFAVLFSPLDLDMIIGSPSLRRNFLNSVLEAVDRDYRISFLEFTKGLRQRNALLERVRETGRRDEKQFEYWDGILIKSGEVIAKKREELVNFFNSSQKDIFDFVMFYDKSIISKERLLQYKEQELGAGVTLVGPHRDDFSISMFDNVLQTTHDVKFFGSRGQQRLAILQLKFLELSFIEQKTKEQPILLLDDIFSELDEEHIHLILEMIPSRQTIITTTHKEFIENKLLKGMDVIELGK